jgi:hypothetical protein
MTTLGTLKATIADDLARGDLTSQIAAAITQAIAYYKEERLFWMDTRTENFDTVADQADYDVDDEATIPLFIKIDAIFLEDSDGIRYGPLERIDQTVMERLQDESASTGRPDAWSWFNDTIWFHPIPDAAYTVRPMGQIAVAEPSSDSQTDNKWMTKGYELIRCRAKMLLFAHTVKDVEQAMVMRAAAQEELEVLRRDTSKRTATGAIVATQF